MLTDKNIARPGAPTLTERLAQKLRAAVSKGGRKKINEQYKSALNCDDFTIIASFCGGGTLYHDLGMRFLSPTINLAFDGPDFVRFCMDLPHYLAQEIVEYKTDAVNYPVGRLGDVEIRFVHFHSFEEAKQKWEERARRINWDKILIMATDRDGMTDCMEQFDKISYRKIMYTAKQYPRYDWAVYCPCFRGKDSVGVMTGIADVRGHRFYERYVDIPEILNAL